jgi:hypothetical protein
MEVLKIVEEVSLFDFIILNLAADNSNKLKDLILEMFSLIFKETISLSIKGYFIDGKNNIINQKNFPKIIQIIKDQNAIKEREEKVVTKKERDYKEEVRRVREKYRKYLKATGKSNDTDLLDIISSISSKHPSLNLFNIYKLTIYQLIDQFKRINLIDEYFINIDSLLAGADKANIHLIH